MNLPPTRTQIDVATVYIVARGDDAANPLVRLGWGRRENVNVFTSRLEAIEQALKWQKKHPHFVYSVYAVDRIGVTTVTGIQTEWVSAGSPTT